MAKDLTFEHHRGTPRDVAEILRKPISQEMLDRDLARLAYVAKDGTPTVNASSFTLVELKKEYTSDEAAPGAR